MLFSITTTLILRAASRLLICAMLPARLNSLPFSRTVNRSPTASISSVCHSPVGLDSRAAVADLKQAMTATDREIVHDKTHALNHATQHLAEVMMNRTVREALAGKNVTDV